MNIISIIPARMGSSRFPNKPMKKINGIPMIGHVYYRVNMCNLLTDNYVATCDEEIYDYIIGIGGKAVMTSGNHERASDRAAEAMLIIEDKKQSKVDIVVMVQGDEPMVTPEMISKSLEPFNNDAKINVVNLMAKIKSITEFNDPNEIKVIFDNNFDAIYFSREGIPSAKKYPDKIPMYKQVCIIPFIRDYLIKFNSLPEGKLERIESIDMLRIIENSEKVRMVPINNRTISVDTSSDLLRVSKAMKDDHLIKKYSI